MRPDDPDGFDTDVDDDIWTHDEPGASEPGRLRGHGGDGIDPRPGELGSVESHPSITSRDLAPEPEPVSVDPGGPDRPRGDADADADVENYADRLGDAPEKLPRWVLVLGVIALFMGIVVGGVMFWYDRQVNPPGPLGAEVELEIRRGTSASGLGPRLADRGIVRNGLLFNFWAGRNQVGIKRAGVYVFNENMSYDEVREVLESDPSGEVGDSGEIVHVLIPEGLTVEQIANRIHGAVSRFEVDDIRAALDSPSVVSNLKPDDVDSWEGLLFPAKYEVSSTSSIEDFLNVLAAEMQKRVASLDPDESVGAINDRYGLDLDVYDVLKVASLVQSEAGGAAEAGKIASVIYNRLEKDSTAWALGIDASDEYGAALEGMTPGEYRETDGAYNLRKLAGLPPTPISAPGDYALEAAFDPEDTEFMWYVLEAPGVHTFVVTDAEFQAAKARCKAAGLGCG